MQLALGTLRKGIGVIRPLRSALGLTRGVMEDIIT